MNSGPYAEATQMLLKGPQSRRESTPVEDVAQPQKVFRSLGDRSGKPLS